jgi:hypothetical protein
MMMSHAVLETLGLDVEDREATGIAATVGGRLRRGMGVGARVTGGAVRGLWRGSGGA